MRLELDGTEVVTTTSRWKVPHRVAHMAIALFDRWELSPENRAVLLDISEGALGHYGESDVADSSWDRFERIGHLLAIHKNLRLLFPQNRDLRYRWMTTRNQAFDGQTPVEVVRARGLLGLLTVRAYLDRARGQ